LKPIAIIVEFEVKMNVLVIGSGGREHAICWKLQQSNKVSTVYAFPGSPAIAQLEKSKVVGGLNLKDFQVGCDSLSSYQLLSFRDDLLVLPPTACIRACLTFC
jgi:hypothetical protein